MKAITAGNSFRTEVSMNPKVKINVASYDEIRALPFLKDAAARNIIEERGLNGPFSGPDDLARRVKGLGDDLPRMLSTYLDWVVPVQPEEPKERRWWRIALWVTLIILLPAAVIYPTYTKLLWTLVEFRPLLSESTRRLLTIGAVAGPIPLLFIEAFFVTVIVGDFTHSRRTERKWSTYGYKVNIAGAIVSLILLGAFAVLAPREVPADFPPFIRGILLLMTMPVFLLLIYGLPLYVKDRRGLIGSRLLGGVYGTAIIFGPPLVLIALHLTLTDIPMPTALYVLEILLGAAVVHRSYQMLRDRCWYFSQVVGALDPSVDPAEARKGRELLEWINRELPNEFDQRALARAMVSKYPAVRRAPFAGLTLAAGLAWLIITKGLEAIYEQMVQGWAEPYLQTMKKFLGW